MVNPCFACKNNCGKIKYVDLLLAKIPGKYTLNLNKGFKINFKIVFFSQVEIWRFWIRRLRLGY